LTFGVVRLCEQLMLRKQKHAPWSDDLLQLMKDLVASVYAAVPDL
jgi:hypothetical protein